MDLQSMLFFVLACALSGFSVSVIATMVIRRNAPQWGLIDHPAERKVHGAPTPLGGGLAIWLGVIVPLLTAQLLITLPTTRAAFAGLLPGEVALHLDEFLAQSHQLWIILTGGTLLCVTGLIDDLRNLPWWPRLLIQLFVAAGLVLGGVRGSVFELLPWVGGMVSILWMIILINSFNFLDNMDGLSAGTTLICAVIFSILMLGSTAEPRWLVGGVLLVLTGALAGFLCFNWSPASIFMGDCGSYFIGLLMASMTIVGTFYDYSGANLSGGRHVMLAPLLVLAIPLYDFCSVLIIRVRNDRSPFHADKKHFSHRLVEMGLRPSQAVLTILLATGTTGLGALLLYQVDGWSDALLICVLVACLLAIIAILETVGRQSAAQPPASSTRQVQESDEPSEGPVETAELTSLTEDNRA